MPNNHQVIKNQLKPGDIILSRKPGSPISEVIRGITKSKWSHALMYIGDDVIIESDWDGVVTNPLSKYFSNEYEIGLFRITPELTTEETDQLIKAIKILIGRKYAWFQLVWQFILRIFKKSEDKDWAIDVENGFICSELIAFSYEQINRKIVDLPPSETEPGDLDASPQTIRIA